MAKAKYLIIAGITAAVLVLAACSVGFGDAAAREQQITETQGQDIETQNVESRAESTEATARQPQYVKLKPEEAKEVMESDEKLTLVDVRTPEEYMESRIGNAINIPVEDIGAEQPEELPDLDAKIMVYCRSGVRSRKAAEKLLELGYKNVIDIGGIKDWPYETVSGDE